LNVLRPGRIVDHDGVRVLEPKTSSKAALTNRAESELCFREKFLIHKKLNVRICLGTVCTLVFISLGENGGRLLTNLTKED